MATKKIGEAAAALRAYALGFPETREDFPWGHSAFKVRGKGFLFTSVDDGGLSLSVKLPKSRLDALRRPVCEPTHYGMGKYGWVTAKLARGDEVPLAELKAWIDESFRAIAPKTIVKKLDGAVSASPKRAARPRAPGRSAPARRR